MSYLEILIRCELIEVLKANQFESDKLAKIQDKISAISYQEKPTLGLYILGQVLLASFALNDICGNGKFPSDEFRSIKDKIERESKEICDLYGKTKRNT